MIFLWSELYFRYHIGPAAITAVRNTPRSPLAGQRSASHHGSSGADFAGVITSMSDLQALRGIAEIRL